MKPTLITVGIVLLLLGIVWIFQGFGILPGSFMTGDMKWAVIGAIIDTVGIALLLLGLSLKRESGSPQS